ncbi:hypothetical protein I4F81_010434 [Pyropia yezoensis]|uniref:Uncharacterized protein n=1 Tax=Pyropia yezoensis TaxID=2788 RepID=A0ACC3CCP0_PYRYE|nr:hypothetical protein I4F81_010434 [Neopyropia yezoensis]
MTALLADVVLPAACVVRTGYALDALLWETLSMWPPATRYAIYRQVEALVERGSSADGRNSKGAIRSYPLLSLAAAEAVNDVRQILKRVTKENVREYGRRLATATRGVALGAFASLLARIERYGNMVSPLVDALRYLDCLGFDVLACSCVDALARGGRQRLKPDGVNVSMWYMGLCTFTSVLLRRYSNVVDVQPVLHLIFNGLHAGDALLLLLLREMIGRMGGGEVITEPTDRHLALQVAGPALRGVVADIPVVASNVKAPTSDRDRGGRGGDRGRDGGAGGMGASAGGAGGATPTAAMVTAVSAEGVFGLYGERRGSPTGSRAADILRRALVESDLAVGLPVAVAQTRSELVYGVRPVLVARLAAVPVHRLVKEWHVPADAAFTLHRQSIDYMTLELPSSPPAKAVAASGGERGTANAMDVEPSPAAGEATASADGVAAAGTAAMDVDVAESVEDGEIDSVGVATPANAAADGGAASDGEIAADSEGEIRPGLTPVGAVGGPAKANGVANDAATVTDDRTNDGGSGGEGGSERAGGPGTPLRPDASDEEGAAGSRRRRGRRDSSACSSAVVSRAPSPEWVVRGGGSGKGTDGVGGGGGGDAGKPPRPSAWLSGGRGGSSRAPAVGPVPVTSTVAGSGEGGIPEPVLSLDGVRAMLPATTWDALHPELYATFWALRPGDLAVPRALYAAEVRAARDRLDAATRAARAAAGERERDRDRDREWDRGDRGDRGWDRGGDRADRAVVAAAVVGVAGVSREALREVDAELTARLARVEAVRGRLAERRGHLLVGVAAPSRSMSALLSTCLLPRALVSHADAREAAAFVDASIVLDVPGMDVVALVRVLGECLAPTLFSCTEAEASRLGRFLGDLLRMFERWRADRGVYTAECAPRAAWSAGHAAASAAAATARTPDGVTGTNKASPGTPAASKASPGTPAVTKASTETLAGTTASSGMSAGTKASPATQAGTKASPATPAGTEASPATPAGAKAEPAAAAASSGTEPPPAAGATGGTPSIAATPPPPVPHAAYASWLAAVHARLVYSFVGAISTAGADYMVLRNAFKVLSVIVDVFPRRRADGDTLAAAVEVARKAAAAASLADIKLMTLSYEAHLKRQAAVGALIGPVEFGCAPPIPVKVRAVGAGW